MNLHIHFKFNYERSFFKALIFRSQNNVFLFEPKLYKIFILKPFISFYFLTISTIHRETKFQIHSLFTVHLLFKISLFYKVGIFSIFIKVLHLLLKLNSEKIIIKYLDNLLCEYIIK
jgi:hypothetical protein